MSNPLQTANDELDLNELLTILLKHKLLIFIITLMMGVGGIFYSWTVTPVYKGEVLIEVGEVIINSDLSNNKPTIIKPLESTNDTIQILTQNYNTSGNEVIVFGSSSNSVFIQISYEHSDKKIIQNKLEQMSQFTIKRHQEKADFFKKLNSIIRPTIMASAINISENPIKPNKQLIIIISFFSGFILSLFIVLLLEFLNKRHQIHPDKQ